MATTLVMGILNITPDSFSDGGKYFSYEAALMRAEAMIGEGVDIIDIGGESTRPGAERISVEEEAERVIPVVKELATRGVVVSVDTMRSSIARDAINAGAKYVNDVSGGLADPDMAKVIAEHPDIQYVAMHWRAHSKVMNDAAIYDDVVREVKAELEARVEALTKSGVQLEQIIIDPGLGFSKNAEHNWSLLRNVDCLHFLGLPILIGASRKRFLGELLDGAGIEARENASTAITTYCAMHEVWAVRTHTVAPHKEAIRVVNQLR